MWKEDEVGGRKSNDTGKLRVRGGGGGGRSGPRKPEVKVGEINKMSNGLLPEIS